MEHFNDKLQAKIDEFVSIAKGETSTLSEQRMQICKPCQFYSRWGRCARCGCVLAMKTRVPSMKCPIGKW